MNTRSDNPIKKASFSRIRGKLLVFSLFIALVLAGCSKNDELTLRNEQFMLNPVGASGISGTVFIAENSDSSFNITVKLNSSIKDTVHIMNIYNPGAGPWGTISVKLADIVGTGGPVIGETKNIRQAIASTGNFGSSSYDQVIRETKTIKVFLSRNYSDSLLSQAVIGR